MWAGAREKVHGTKQSSVNILSDGSDTPSGNNLLEMVSSNLRLEQR